MKAISFSLTERQFLDGSKDVTRRLGWLKLKAGDRLRAVRKAMGLKKGEKLHVLGEIEIVSVRRERLDHLTKTIAYGYNEVIREGFPEMGPRAFVAFFCKSHRGFRLGTAKKGCTPETIITRIEFRKMPNNRNLTADENAKE